MKLNFDSIINTSLGVLLGAGVGVLALIVANRLFGVFAYPSLSPDQVDKVAKQYDSRFRTVTRACDSTHCRGIYDMGGSLYYYNWEKGSSYTIFPMMYERYSTDFSLGDKPPLVFP